MCRSEIFSTGRHDADDDVDSDEYLGNDDDVGIEDGLWAMEEALLDYIRQYGLSDKARVALKLARPTLLAKEPARQKVLRRHLKSVGSK